MMTYLSPWILFFIILAIGIGSAEAGVWMSKRRMRRHPEKQEGPVGSLIGAMLGLLAFMLGITFSITSTRFASRKELVIEQARAISTCYLRTNLIPQKQKDQSRMFIKEYVDILVMTKTPDDINITLSEMDDLNTQIWNQAASLLNEQMDSELRSLYIRSVNDVIDVYNKRKTVALVYKISGAVWTTLILLFILSMFVVGYEIGEQRRRRMMNAPLMTVAFALVVTLIADMDSAAYSKNFKVNLQALKDVQKMIEDNKS